MANLGAVAIVGLLGVSAYAYSKYAQGKKKEKLKAKKKARVNTVELWSTVEELPEPPFVGLMYCDNASGRAVLEKFTEVGRTYKGPKLFAISAENAGEGPCPEGLPPAVLMSQRLKGSWLESISGEDQEEYMLLGPNEEKMRAVLGWAMGTGDVPLEQAVWVGDPDVLWRDLTERAQIVDLNIVTQYEIPVAPPDPVLPVSISSSNEAVLSAFSSDIDDPAGQYIVVLPAALAEDVTVTVVQGNWKKHVIFRVVE